MDDTTAPPALLPIGDDAPLIYRPSWTGWLRDRLALAFVGAALLLATLGICYSLFLTPDRLMPRWSRDKAVVAAYFVMTAAVLLDRALYRPTYKITSNEFSVQSLWSDERRYPWETVDLAVFKDGILDLQQRRHRTSYPLSLHEIDPEAREAVLARIRGAMGNGFADRSREVSKRVSRKNEWLVLTLLVVLSVPLSMMVSFYVVAVSLSTFGEQSWLWLPTSVFFGLLGYAALPAAFWVICRRRQQLER